MNSITNRAHPSFLCHSLSLAITLAFIVVLNSNLQPIARGNKNKGNNKRANKKANKNKNSIRKNNKKSSAGQMGDCDLSQRLFMTMEKYKEVRIADLNTNISITTYYISLMQLKVGKKRWSLIADRRPFQLAY